MKVNVSPAEMIEFFRTAPLESAKLVLGLCQGEVSTREKKSADAKARAGTPAKPKKAKKSHKKKAPGPAPVSQAADTSAGEAGDLKVD